MNRATPPAASPAVSPDADMRRRRLDAHAMIDLSFDIAKGCYKDGYSDDRIAKEMGLPKGWVVKRREDEFGPLKTPSEIAAVVDEVTRIASEIASLQTRLQQMAKTNGWSA